MKHLFLIFFLLFSLKSFSQVEFYLGNGSGYDTLNILNGSTVNLNESSSFVELTMGCKNTSSDSLDLFIKRKIFTSSWSFLNDQLCDNNLCYSPSGSDFTTPIATVLGSGEITILKSSFLFSNTNTSIYVRYYALDENLNMIDSVDFSLNNATGINQKFNPSEIVISSLQNNSEIFVSNTSNYLKLNLKIYDILGNLIKESVLYESETKLYFDLAKGTYIITIDSNGQVLKSKKIVAL
ncbi:MAG: T9SS type A sorting domain-containing protein [Flavobacteriales bacterium]|nr:T9SS type A sorting domain-containing protein [Flavobacteriales bacterium]